MYRQIVDAVSRPGTIVDFICLKRGYFSSPTTAYRSAYNAIGMVERGYQAEKKGYDAFMIGCASDPGLIESRSLLKIPVTGPLESSSLLASTLGDRFSVVLLEKAGRPFTRKKIRDYGLENKLASVRYVDGVSVSSCIAAIEMKEHGKVIDQILEEVRRAVKKDSAETVIIGCTIGSSLLTVNGVHHVDGIPLIDTIAAELKMAEIMVDLKRSYGISPCKSTVYKAPPPDWEQEVPMKMEF
jgi:allantoin racemase